MADVIDLIRRELARDSRGIVAAYVFGSVARGTDHAASDVDVAIWLAGPPPSHLAQQRFDLEDDLRGVAGRPVQLVILNQAPPDLVHRVLRDGILVHESDRAARVRFEVKARNEYFDVLPYLRLYRRGRAA